MLGGQDLGGGQKQSLEAVEMGDVGCNGGDDGFAAADVTLQQTVHRMCFQTSRIECL